MSVLIKGMKMPKNCTICRFCVPEADPGNGEMCMATGKYVPSCTKERLDDCPLAEVSEKAVSPCEECPFIKAEEGEDHEQN